MTTTLKPSRDHRGAVAMVAVELCGYRSEGSFSRGASSVSLGCQVLKGKSLEQNVAGRDMAYSSWDHARLSYGNPSRSYLSLIFEFDPLQTPCWLRESQFQRNSSGTIPVYSICCFESWCYVPHTRIGFWQSSHFRAPKDDINTRILQSLGATM